MASRIDGLRSTPPRHRQHLRAVALLWDPGRDSLNNRSNRSRETDPNSAPEFCNTAGSRSSAERSPFPLHFCTRLSQYGSVRALRRCCKTRHFRDARSSGPPRLVAKLLRRAGSVEMRSSIRRYIRWREAQKKRCRLRLKSRKILRKTAILEPSQWQSFGMLTRLEGWEYMSFGKLASGTVVKSSSEEPAPFQPDGRDLAGGVGIHCLVCVRQRIHESDSKTNRNNRLSGYVLVLDLDIRSASASSTRTRKQPIGQRCQSMIGGIWDVQRWLFG